MVVCALMYGIIIFGYVSLIFDTEVQVTKDGELNKILNGITDWVYEEEFAVTNLMAWSPDSEYLAFVRFDESEVPGIFYADVW